MSGDVTVDPGDPTPPYEQLRRQLERHIRSGAIAGGTRLAPVRQLAADLALAPGTVARAYKQLEADGLVVTRRGAGTRAAGGFGPADAAGHLDGLARDFVAQARRLGLADDAIAAAVSARLTEPVSNATIARPGTMRPSPAEPRR